MAIKLNPGKGIIIPSVATMADLPETWDGSIMWVDDKSRLLIKAHDSWQTVSAGLGIYAVGNAGSNSDIHCTVIGSGSGNLEIDTAKDYAPVFTGTLVAGGMSGKYYCTFIVSFKVSSGTVSNFYVEITPEINDVEGEYDLDISLVSNEIVFTFKRGLIDDKVTVTGEINV